MKRFISFALSAALTMTAIPTIVNADPDSKATTTVTYQYSNSSDVQSREMETLDRGLVAVKTDDGIFLSWRLLGSESTVMDVRKAPAFTVYKNGKELATVSDSTNYLDTSGKASDKYSVAINGGEKCTEVTVNTNSYFDIPLVKPDNETIYYPEEYGGAEVGTFSFSPADCSTADLDGDGEYEIIVKWVSHELDVGSPGSVGYSGTVRFNAYKLDGTKLWENDINLGKNVYSSAHTVQFVVYDFNGDGKAEMICQTSLGSKDSTGTYVSHSAKTEIDIYNLTDEENEAADYRGSYVLCSGEEFLTVFNGETGEAMDTITLAANRGSDGGADYGDTSGNRSNRFTAGVAYLDGVKPYAAYVRGYYMQRTTGKERTSACAVSFDGEKLSNDYKFDTNKNQDGYTSGNEKYAGNGNHNICIADVDGDGKDEIITGALCLEADDNNKLNPRWCTFMEHGDALHIGDYDPTHAGLEFFTVHEDKGPNKYTGTEINYGISVIDADTGEVMIHVTAPDDTGRGIMANTGAEGYYQIWGAQNTGPYAALGNNIFKKIDKFTSSMNFRTFWNGSLYDELLNGTAVESYTDGSMTTIFNAANYDCYSINSTKSVPSLQADLFGDWREELVYPADDGNTLRVFTTTELTNYRLPTLMHDPVYRNGVAAEQSGYNQPPHIGFYLSEDLYATQIESITINSLPDKTQYTAGENLDTTGLSVMALYENGVEQYLGEYTLSGYNKYAAGVQTVTISAANGVSASFDVTVTTDFTVTPDGYISAYNGTDTEAIIPEVIDGVKVIGISENVFNNTTLTKLTVLDSITDIKDNTFGNITVYCYSGSKIEEYVIENDIPYDLIAQEERSYIIDEDYTESAYTGFSMLQGGSSQTDTINGIIYGVGGRSNKDGSNGGDGISGFRVADGILHAQTGRFSNSNRNAYMTFSDQYQLSNAKDVVLSARIMIPMFREGITSAANISDGSNTIDSISVSQLGIEFDKWYTYKLIYHRGTYYRVILNDDGTLFSISELSTTGTKSVNKISFVQESGSYGNGDCLEIEFDNLQLYNISSALSTITVLVSDTNDNPVSNAKVTIGTQEATTASNGTASVLCPVGVYTIAAAADEYSGSKKIAAYDESNYIIIKLCGYTASEAEGSYINLIPSNASYTAADAFSNVEGTAQTRLNHSAAKPVQAGTISTYWGNAKSSYSIYAAYDVCVAAGDKLELVAKSNDDSIGTTFTIRGNYNKSATVSAIVNDGSSVSVGTLSINTWYRVVIEIPQISISSGFKTGNATYTIYNINQYNCAETTGIAVQRTDLTPRSLSGKSTTKFTVSVSGTPYIDNGAIYMAATTEAAPTAEPTAQPTLEPTAEPTLEPTPVPTPDPTAEPTAQPINKIEVQNQTVKITYVGTDGYKLYAAKYNNYILEAVKIYDIDEDKELTFNEIGFEPDKLFLWNSNQKPIAKWIK